MDDNKDYDDKPKEYNEETGKSIEDTKKFIWYVNGLEPKVEEEEKLVHPIISPRYALSSTRELLEGLGDIAKTYKNIRIQSHLSENLAEIDAVSKKFPEQPNYTSVYNSYGLLNDRTIMGHSIHLSLEELKLIKDKEAGIAHCPTSNFDLRSGICNVRRLLDKEIKVGLGSDVSGGHSQSMLTTIRNASIASRVITMPEWEKVPDYRPELTLPELTYLATMGGAKLVNLEKKIGNFCVGKDFDALLIDPETLDPYNYVPKNESDDSDHVKDVERFLRIFEKFIFLGDEKNIISVYVKGKKIEFEKDLPEKELLKNLSKLDGSNCHVCNSNSKNNKESGKNVVENDDVKTKE